AHLFGNGVENILEDFELNGVAAHGVARRVYAKGARARSPLSTETPPACAAESLTVRKHFH
ncbi:MAG: hypothetical protein ACRESV_01775, partial [Nevskiales bacterium]